MRTRQTKLIKIATKEVRQAQSTCFQMAEVSITQCLFAAILGRNQRRVQPEPA